MGMDVYGKAARSKTGEYFQNNVWWWRALADYCVTVAPKVCEPCKYWQSNDGDGLDDAGARALADALQTEVDAGRTLIYEKAYTGAQELTPDEDCRICAGTGVRKAVPHIGAGDLKMGGAHLQRVRRQRTCSPVVDVLPVQRRERRRVHRFPSGQRWVRDLLRRAR